MRKVITGMAAAAALMVAGAAPAMACWEQSPCSGGLFTSFAAPQASWGYHHHHHHPYAATVSVGYERLPDPQGPQYYYVNQGPTYSGPGNWAPVPTYQERAVTGWRGYDRGYYYGYNGGPYGNATSHVYDGMPRVQGPVVYRYRPHAWRAAPRAVRPYGVRPHGYSMRYGYHHRPARYGYAPLRSRY
jgi:hypothetical protein